MGHPPTLNMITDTTNSILDPGKDSSDIPQDPMGDITSVAKPSDPSMADSGEKWVQNLLANQPNNPLGLDTKATTPTYTCNFQSQMGTIGMYTCMTANGIVGQLTVSLSQVQKGCSGITTFPLVMIVSGFLTNNFTISGCQ
jgi:hypothetical protein